MTDTLEMFETEYSGVTGIKATDDNGNDKAFEYGLAKHFKKYKEKWNAIFDSDKIQISQDIRGRSVNEGMQLEMMTVKEWIEHIEKII